MTEKLHSDRGASLSAALLIFLVCAVTGAVLLTAATAAAGRESDLAVMDQRYYSVTSAARLLAKELNGKSVTIVREKETVTIERFDIDDPSHLISSDGTAAFQTKIADTRKIDTESFFSNSDGSIPVGSDGVIHRSFLTDRAISLMYGITPVCNNELSFGFSFADSQLGDAGDTGSFFLRHDFVGPSPSDGAVLAEALITRCDYTLRRDGTLLMEIQNSGTGTDRYTLLLTLKAEIQEIPTVESSFDVSVSSGEITEKTTTKETKTSTVTWKVSSMGGVS